MACHCNEFSRAHLMRQAVAQAGQGLPSIEPGQPVPAGTGLNRRSFMLRSGAAMLSVYGASKLGFRQLQEGIAAAQAGAGSGPILVSVFMEGGADALSILSPVTDQRYKDLRPTLALGEDEGVQFAEDGNLRWHPSAAKLDTLHREGKVTVFPAIGYTDPDQSHFTSRHYWEVGELDPNGRTGWMGRLLDEIGSDDNPLQGLSLDGYLSPALATASKPVAAIDGPSYDLWAHDVWGDVETLMLDSIGTVASAHEGLPDLGRKTAGIVGRRASQLRKQLEPFGGGDIVIPPEYPDNYFAKNLSALASMIKFGLPIRCASISAAGSYDTHEGEEDSFPADLQVTADSLYAFQRHLESLGIADRVLTLVWSEFGRRPEENGSQGTDHGAAGTAFLIGSRAKGQMIGEHPGLAVLDEDDNMRHNSDFRDIYSGLLEQWFDVDAGAIIPDAGIFSAPRPVLVKS
jgi:uncharacterized protein (DUF1501 family)